MSRGMNRAGSSTRRKIFSRIHSTAPHSLLGSLRLSISAAKATACCSCLQFPVRSPWSEAPARGTLSGFLRIEAPESHARKVCCSKDCVRTFVLQERRWTVWANCIQLYTHYGRRVLHHLPNKAGAPAVAINTCNVRSRLLFE